MICKKDVILWFKELESYKRIDVMCTLLNMCLPFELRFLGTCLEELGRRDSQELRGIELRVNSPQDLASDMIACQKGEPTDKKIRRKMALYLALIRASNRSCVTEIFRTLDCWGELEFCSMNDLDTLQELLLVYTMASNHPVFSFDQHMKCTEIFEKIMSNKLLQSEHITFRPADMQPQTLPGLYMTQHITPTQHDILSQEHIFHGTQMSDQGFDLQKLTPVVSSKQESTGLNFTQLPKLLPSDTNHQQLAHMDNIPQGIPNNIPILTDRSISHPNAWNLRNVQEFISPDVLAVEKKPQSSSPMLSHQSSPSSSRASSPYTKFGANSTNIHLQQNTDSLQRSSAECTPSPVGHTLQQTNNEASLPQHIKIMDEGINTDSSMTQLQTLIRNGFGRHALNQKKNDNPNFYSHCHQLPLKQHMATMPPRNIAMNTILTCPMQNIAVIDGGGRESYTSDSSLIDQHQNKSTGSESGSSSVGSCGELSPPETPVLWQKGSSNVNAIQSHDGVHTYIHNQPLNYYNKQISQGRIIDRLDNKKAAVSGGSVPNSIPHNTNSQCNQYMRSVHEMICTLSPCSNVVCKVHSSLANNNIDSKMINIFLDGISGNPNNIAIPVKATFVSPPSTADNCSILGNAITPKTGIEQSNCVFPYNGPNKQTVIAATAPYVISHIPEICPIPPQAFRLPAPPQMPSKADILCTPQVQSAGITALSGVVADSKKAATLRTTSSSGIINQQTPNIVHCNGSQQQLHEIIASNVSQYSTPPPYPYLAVRSKPISCYNCGSQNHSGRDCTESSMDDVSRNSIYKLDFSVSASQPAGNYTRSNTNLNESGSNKIQKSSIIETVETMLTPTISPTAP